jgi:hypothetical protein
MANEEEKETKTKRTAKEPVEIKPDPDLKSVYHDHKSHVKDKGKGSK